ncbi:50S ribosomal protein L29 [Candidatus Uhrbacteria bacterium]|nr:50S ribosomal protein L29 [Candidatus Uhrbacteria bacterium]
MDIVALRTKSPQELDALLTDARARLSDLRFRLHAHELKNVHEIRETRRTIARILTIRNSRKPQADSRKPSVRVPA